MTSAAVTAAVAGSAALAEVLVGRGALAEAGALFRRRFGAPRACLLADERGWAAAGEATEAALHAAGIATRRHVLPADPRPKPTVELADRLAAVLSRDGSVPVAIGSGVMNDVVKHAAFGLDRDYLCIATAASMDGYTSAGAPLSDRGFKKTIQCRPARAVLGDLDVIAAAPAEMTGWGYGDLAGKVPAGADWILADALEVEAVEPQSWSMVQDGLRGWLAAPGRIGAGAPGALEGLFTGLTMVGLAMERHGSSRPASGADHQIAHLWEMEDLAFAGQRVSHGACVAVGCSTVLRLYDWLLRQDLAGLDISAVLARAPGLAQRRQAVGAAFGRGEIADRALEETCAKHPDPATHRRRLERLVAVWPQLRARLEAQLIPAEEMRAMLHAAGAPSDASAIGVDPAHLRRSTLAARFLRSRYTVLDLLDETGLLDAAVEAALAQPAIRA